MKEMVNFTSYNNGIIRNSDGEIAAFFDAVEQTLMITKDTKIYKAHDIEEAMDIIAEKFNK